MTTAVRPSLLPGLLLLLSTYQAHAQQPTNAPSPPVGPPVPAVGATAPDFTFRGATRYGLLNASSRLSDFRGQSVVLWFFIKARTRG